MELNKGQLDAVASNSKATLVLAGAGTGKTRVIITRIAKLITAGIEPTKIVATTFTNKAAKELKERLALTIEPHLANNILCGTFHRISANFLRMYAQDIGIANNFQLLTDDDQRRLIKRILKQYKEEAKAKILIEQISKFKELNEKFVNDKLFHEVYEAYQHELTTNNFMDYSDLIKNSIFLFENKKEICSTLAEHLLIDEYQDINSLQYKWIRLLGENKHIFCVGDEDQSIYAFRGASIKYIQKFEEDFPNANIIKLEENYRSAKEILKSAVTLISKNDKKYEKNLIAANQEKVGIVRIHKAYNEFDEAQLIARIACEWKQKNKDSSIGILVRTNMQIPFIEHGLIEAKIPYHIASGRKFYSKKEIQDIIAYLRAIIFEHDFLAFSRIINTPKRSMGEVRLNTLLSAMQSLKCNFEEALISLLPQLPKNAGEKCKILLMQLKNWRSFKKEMSPEEFIDKILKDVNYIEAEELNEAQKESIKNFKEQIKNSESIEEFLENLQFMDSKEKNEEIQIMTMHAAKGLEFDIVIAPGWEENLFPSPLSKDKAELEEERRLAYVTITRARDCLEIIHVKSRRINGQYKTQMPSRFLYDSK